MLQQRQLRRVLGKLLITSATLLTSPDTDVRLTVDTVQGWPVEPAAADGTRALEDGLSPLQRLIDPVVAEVMDTSENSMARLAASKFVLAVADQIVPREAGGRTAVQVILVARFRLGALSTSRR